MANAQANDNERYEYRVWGKHKSARKLLATLADEAVTEEIDDCYFLVDEPGVNAKVRDHTLKVKRLLGHRRGFERWVSKRHRVADSAPAPFDTLFDDLNLDRPVSGKSYSLTRAVKNLDTDSTATPVFVTKRRTRYRIGSLRAEVADVRIESTGEVLRTLAIEGSDLDALVALRKRLGLKGEENVAVHVALEPER